MVALRVSHESLQFMMVFKAGSSTFTFHSWFCEVETYFCLESQKHNYFLHVQYGYFPMKVLLRFVTLTLS